jgi:hypothetical protein
MSGKLLSIELINQKGMKTPNERCRLVYAFLLASCVKQCVGYSLDNNLKYYTRNVSEETHSYQYYSILS